MSSRKLYSVAVVAGVLSVAIILLVSLNVRDPSTQLRRAAFLNNAAEVKRVVKNNPGVLADVQREAANHDPLFAGINFLALLENYVPAQRDQFAELNRLKLTPLQIAAFHDNTNIAEFLLDSGAQANARAAGNLTALHLAAIRGSTNVIRLLLAHGAQINAKNTHGFTSLHAALLAGRVETAELLLESGADIREKDSGGKTALDRASSFQKTQLMHFIFPRKSN